jgi:hypothetical protein
MMVVSKNMVKKILPVCEKSEGYKYQGPRTKNLGPYSGEEFRNAHLIPWLDTLEDNEEAVVDFSGTIVYTPSFLEESFGGSVRINGKNKEKFSHVKFVNMDKFWEENLMEYIINAKPFVKK